MSADRTSKVSNIGENLLTETLMFLFDVGESAQSEREGERYAMCNMEVSVDRHNETTTM